MTELTIPITPAPLTQSYLDELWAQPHNEVEDALLLHIYTMQQIQEKLVEALVLIASYETRNAKLASTKSNKQMVELAKAALRSSEYSAEIEK